MTQTSRADGVDAFETARLQEFVKGIADYAIFMLSPEGYVRSWNVGAVRAAGLSHQVGSSGAGCGARKTLVYGLMAQPGVQWQVPGQACGFGAKPAGVRRSTEASIVRFAI